MSKRLIWQEDKVEKQVIYDEDECRYKYDDICFNIKITRKLGKKCHGCKHFEKEDCKREPLIK